MDKKVLKVRRPADFKEKKSNNWQFFWTKKSLKSAGLRTFRIIDKFLDKKILKVRRPADFKGQNSRIIDIFLNKKQLSRHDCELTRNDIELGDLVNLVAFGLTVEIALHFAK